MNKFEIVIEKDLKCYSQDNPAPHVLDIEDEDGQRHYEFGEVCGLVAINVPPEGNYWFLIEIRGDDGWWYIPDNGFICSLAWYNDVYNVAYRMFKWVDERFEIKNTMGGFNIFKKNYEKDRPKDN